MRHDAHAVEQKQAEVKREKEQRAYYREKLKEALKTIPKWLVDRGSVQAVKQYKAVCMIANKVLANSYSSSADLQTQIAQVKQFEREEDRA